MRPRKLLVQVEATLQQNPAASLAPVIDAFDIPNMSLGFARHFFSALFPNDTSLKTRLGKPLDVPAARRHLLVHRAGIVDQQYLDQSNENLPLGSSLVIKPQDLRDAFRAVVDAAAALAVAANARL